MWCERDQDSNSPRECGVHDRLRTSWDEGALLQRQDRLTNVESGDGVRLLRRAAQDASVPEGLDPGRVLIYAVIDAGRQAYLKIARQRD